MEINKDKALGLDISFNLVFFNKIITYKKYIYIYIYIYISFNFVGVLSRRMLCECFILFKSFL